jgi:hypothetical protein
VAPAATNLSPVTRDYPSRARVDLFQAAALRLFRTSASRRELVVPAGGGQSWGVGGAWARSRGRWVWCARAPGLISVRDPAVQPVGDVMVDGVFPLE